MAEESDCEIAESGNSIGLIYNALAVNLLVCADCSSLRFSVDLAKLTSSGTWAILPA